MSRLEKKTSYAPIVFLVYNRLNHAKQSISFLKKNNECKESELFIFSDGPKEDVSAEEQHKVEEVRAFLKTVTGFKHVELIAQPKNLGLANSVELALDTLLFERNFQSAIVIEDDVCVSRYFLEYANRALALYAHEDRVKMIAPGCYGLPVLSRKSAFFLPHGTASAWATWKRAWEQYEKKPQGYEVLKQNFLQRWKFNLYGGAKFFQMLQDTVESGKKSSWAAKFKWMVFKTNGLTLYPSVYLNKNIGIDGSGTHHKQKKKKEHHRSSFEHNRITGFPQKVRPHRLYFVWLVVFLIFRRLKESIIYRLKRSGGK